MKLPCRSSRGFSLLEVLIAAGIFFMVLFAILALVSQGLRMARGLRQSGATPAMTAAELSNTNRLEEGSESGDFGDIYPDYSWSRDCYEISSNGLWRADITVSRQLGRDMVDSHMSILLFRPESTVRR